VITADILGPDMIIVIVVAVIVLLFGGSKLPKLARGLGGASHEFKKGLEEGANESKASSVPTTVVATPPTVVAAPPTVVTSPPAIPTEAEAIPKDASSS
jgi:sec-independent protein translocase protein TatA